MSRTRPTAHDLRLLAFECRHCGAPIGEWCTRPNGSWSPWPHSDRYYDFHKTDRETPL